MWETEMRERERERERSETKEEEEKEKKKSICQLKNERARGMGEIGKENERARDRARE